MTTRPGTKREQVKLSRDSSEPRMSRWKIVTSTDEWALREKKREREEEGREMRSQKLQRNAFVYIRRISFFMNPYFLLDFTKVFSWECILYVFTITCCLIDVFKILWRKRSADFYEYRSSFPLRPSRVVKCLSRPDREFPTFRSITVNDSTFLSRIWKIHQSVVFCFSFILLITKR